MPLPLPNFYVHTDCYGRWLYHPFCPKSSHLRTKEDVQQTTRRLGPRSVCEESQSATPTSPWRPPVHWSRKCHRTSPHCWWPPATSPPPLGESCTHRPCHPHPSCPLLKGPDDPDWCVPLKYICSANINNATVLRVAVRGSKRALGTKPTVLHFPKYTSHHWL